jgi:hypothetical protein
MDLIFRNLLGLSLAIDGDRDWNSVKAKYCWLIMLGQEKKAGLYREDGTEIKPFGHEEQLMQGDMFDPGYFIESTSHGEENCALSVEMVKF